MVDQVQDMEGMDMAGKVQATDLVPVQATAIRIVNLTAENNE